MYHVAEEAEAKKHYILETALGQMKHRINVKTYFKDFFLEMIWSFVPSISNCTNFGVDTKANT